MYCTLYGGRLPGYGWRRYAAACHQTCSGRSRRLRRTVGAPSAERARLNTPDNAAHPHTDH